MRILLTSAGPLASLVEFFVTRAPSLGSQRVTALGVGLLLDFCAANPALLADPSRRHLAFSQFLTALEGGTVALDGADLSGLYWTSRHPARARVLLDAVAAFADWTVWAYSATPLDLRRPPASDGERIRLLRVLDQRRTRDILAHTRPPGSGRAILTAPAGRRGALPVGPPARPPAFPESRIIDLLQQGFADTRLRTVSGADALHNVRDQLVTILLHGGGLRISEVMHLWLDDVREREDAPGRAEVRIYHPTLGLAPPRTSPVTGRPERLCRSEHLRIHHGMQPRTEALGSAWAGWKDPAVHDPRGEAYLPVFWFPDWWGSAFWALWREYVRHHRPRQARHPFAFATLSERHRAQPLTIAAFEANHRRAVRRIGLNYAKAAGTTPHGHRHAFGQRLADAGVPVDLRQLCLHHKSALSQLPYTVPDAGRANRLLRLAEARLADLVPPTGLAHFGGAGIPYGFRDVDPHGLFAAASPG